MTKRPPHSAHEGCAYTSWTACDKAQKIVWGQCKAVVGDKEPVPCTRWAVGADGWCWQHYASESERVMREARSIAIQAELNARIDAYIAMTEADPSFWLKYLRPSEESTRGLAGVAGVEPTRPVLETARPPRLTPTKPFRLTELA